MCIYMFDWSLLDQELYPFFPIDERAPSNPAILIFSGKVIVTTRQHLFSGVNRSSSEISSSLLYLLTITIAVRSVPEHVFVFASTSFRGDDVSRSEDCLHEPHAFIQELLASRP